MLSSQFFSCGPSSLAIQGALQDGFCNGVVSSDVAKPGEVTSFHCCQQGLLLSSKGVYLLCHIFVYFMLKNMKCGGVFKYLYASLCICCQSPALAYVEEDGYSEGSVELKLGLQADVSALPDGVKS